MITENHRKAILEAIGKHHIAKIIAHAKEKNVRKDDGREFSHSTFSHVLNGRLDHPVIEETIFSAAEFHLQQRNEQEQRRASFIEKVKSKKK